MYLVWTLLFSVTYAQVSDDDNTPPESPTFAHKELSSKNIIELYPNPVTEFVTVNIKNSTFDKVEFELYNIIGNKLNVQVEETGYHRYKLNLKELNSGYYLLIIKDPGKKLNKSFKFQKM